MIELDIEHSQVPSAKCVAKTRGAIALAACGLRPPQWSRVAGAKIQIQYKIQYKYV
jgi:hypothetical protein